MSVFNLLGLPSFFSVKSLSLVVNLSSCFSLGLATYHFFFPSTFFLFICTDLVQSKDKTKSMHFAKKIEDHYPFHWFYHPYQLPQSFCPFRGKYVWSSHPFWDRQHPQVEGSSNPRACSLPPLSSNTPPKKKQQQQNSSDTTLPPVGGDILKY